MDMNEKLEEIHKDVRQTRDMVRDNLAIQEKFYNILLTIRDNTWHQYKQIHDKLMELFSWKPKS